MFFRSPFFRCLGHDLEHLMTRNMLRNEMMMRNEFLRAMDAFEAFEQQAIERANYHNRHYRNNQRHLRGQEKETQAPTQQAKEVENAANKTKQSETQNMKVKETETKVKEPERKVNENSRELRAQPSRRDAFSEWNNSIDEFFRDVSPFGHRYSIFDDFYPSHRFNSLGRYADEMRTEMDRHFKTLENPEAKEEYPTLADPENTSYFMRVETNDNGHVRVKTVKKAPGTAWETKFEEYKREKSNAENKQTIETKESPKENLETSQKKEEVQAKIAEQPQKSSESAQSA